MLDREHKRLPHLVEDHQVGLAVLRNALDALVLSLATSGFDVAAYARAVRERAYDCEGDDYMLPHDVERVAGQTRFLADHFEFLAQELLVQHAHRGAMEQVCQVTEQRKRQEWLRGKERLQPAAADAGTGGPEDLSAPFTDLV
jgi:hypothetical protein